MLPLKPPLKTCQGSVYTTWLLSNCGGSVRIQCLSLAVVCLFNSFVLHHPVILARKLQHTYDTVHMSYSVEEDVDPLIGSALERYVCTMYILYTLRMYVAYLCVFKTVCSLV